MSLIEHKLCEDVEKRVFSDASAGDPFIYSETLLELQVS